MMFLEPEEIFKKALIAISAICVVAGTAYFVYTNYNDLEDKNDWLHGNIINVSLDLGKTNVELKNIESQQAETKSQLRAEIQKLTAMNTQLVELMKTKDAEYKTQFDKIFREQERLRIELKIEFDKLHASDKSLSRDLAEREDRLQLEIARLKDMNVVHSAIAKQREREIAELNAKLQKEIDWRNKYYYNR